MRLIRLMEPGTNYTYEWPRDTAVYPLWIKYSAFASDGKEHEIIIAFGEGEVYGKNRTRVMVCVDGRPSVHFLGADDYERTGDLLSEISIAGEGSRPEMCRYDTDGAPERYVMFNPVGLRTRVEGPGVRNAWAVVANVGDHQRMAVLAALRNLERLWIEEEEA